MGGACITHMRRKLYTNFSRKTFREETTWVRDLSLDGSIILTWTFKKQDMSVWTGFICLSVTGGALVNPVINLRVP
jgi:hypothetical protein